MIARIVFQGKVLQGDIIVSYILYNTAVIKTLLYNSYPILTQRHCSRKPVYNPGVSGHFNRIKILIEEITCSPRG